MFDFSLKDAPTHRDNHDELVQPTSAQTTLVYTFFQPPVKKETLDTTMIF